MESNIFSNPDIDTINKRYNERLILHGHSPKTLGWSGTKQQHQRFKKFNSILNLQNKSIVDIGCGFGDFYSYLYSVSVNLNKYIGVDINNSLIELAKNNLDNQAKFIVGNILEKKTFNKIKEFNPDIAISMGVFNLNFKKDEKKMYVFFEKMIENMVKLSNTHLIIDFIPKSRSDNYVKEKFIMTYDLEFIAEVMKNLSLKYKIDCTQDPNPMSEAILIAYL